MVNHLSYSLENAPSRIGSGGFGINAQQIFRSRSAEHHPARLAEVDLDAVHIFPANYRQIKDTAQFAIRKVSDGFFFLPRFQIEIDAAVMILAKFRMERSQQFSQGFSVPGHQFREK